MQPVVASSVKSSIRFAICRHVARVLLRYCDFLSNDSGAQWGERTELVSRQSRLEFGADGPAVRVYKAWEAETEWSHRHRDTAGHDSLAHGVPWRNLTGLCTSWPVYGSMHGRRCAHRQPGALRLEYVLQCLCLIYIHTRTQCAALPRPSESGQCFSYKLRNCVANVFL